MQQSGRDVDVVSRWATLDASDVSVVRDAALERITRFGFAECLDDARVMVSELVTNALRHGTGPGAVLVWPSGVGSLIVEVHDTSPRCPRLPSPTAPDEVDADFQSGWGLPMVTTLARQRCGVTKLPTGKSVWFALPLTDLFAPQPVLSGLVVARIWARSVLAPHTAERTAAQPLTG